MSQMPPLKSFARAPLAWLTALAIAAAAPASALSCLAADPVAAFSQANAAEEVYVVVLGTFSGGPGKRAKGFGNAKQRSYLAHFKGHSLNRNGPFEEIDQSVIVEETCAGMWCAEVNMGQEVLTFLKVQASGSPILTVGPCYDNAFFKPTPAQIKAIQQCFASGCTES